MGGPPLARLGRGRGPVDRPIVPQPAIYLSSPDESAIDLQARRITKGFQALRRLRRFSWLPTLPSDRKSQTILSRIIELANFDVPKSLLQYFSILERRHGRPVRGVSLPAKVHAPDDLRTVAPSP